jgi:hypothetical protein
MNRLDRRNFLLCASACTAGLATGARAQTGAKVDEGEPQAVALGYKHDTTKVDQKKFPKHSNDQRCNNCQFFMGKASDPWGNERIAFEAEYTLNRKDYGLNWNAALETGGFLVGDDVKITLSVQAVPVK